MFSLEYRQRSSFSGKNDQLAELTRSTAENSERGVRLNSLQYDDIALRVRTVKQNRKRRGIRRWTWRVFDQIFSVYVCDIGGVKGFKTAIFWWIICDAMPIFELKWLEIVKIRCLKNICGDILIVALEFSGSQDFFAGENE